MGTSVCQITITTVDPQIRIEGTYVRAFYDQLKELVPKKSRAYISSGTYWLVDKPYFCKVFELAFEHFSKVHLFENGRADVFDTKKGQGVV
jgi:hypothetical protein